MAKYLHRNLTNVTELEGVTEANGFPLGTTYEDYLSKKWIELSAAQVAFAEEHPAASAKEIIEMQLAPLPPAQTLEELRAQKLIDLEAEADRQLEALIGGRAVLRSIAGFMDEVEGSAAVAAIQADVEALKTAYEAKKAQIEGATSTEELDEIQLTINN